MLHAAQKQPGEASVLPRQSASCDIFISYRREGGAELAQLLRNALHERRYRIFVDVHDMPSGPFDQSILDAIFHSKDVIVLLTPGSLERCRQQGDWFRTEIATALKAGRNVVPLRTTGFHMPEAAALPADIAPLTRQQSPSYSHEHSDDAINQLCRLLNSRPHSMRSRIIMVAVLASVLLGIVAIAIVQRWQHPSIPVQPARNLPTPSVLPTTAPQVLVERTRRHRHPVRSGSRRGSAPDDIVDLTGEPFTGARIAPMGVSIPLTLTIASQSPSGAITGWLATVDPHGPFTATVSGRFESDGSFYLHYRDRNNNFSDVTGAVNPDGTRLEGKYQIRVSNGREVTGTLELTRP